MLGHMILSEGLGQTSGPSSEPEIGMRCVTWKSLFDYRHRSTRPVKARQLNDKRIRRGGAPPILLPAIGMKAHGVVCYRGSPGLARLPASNKSVEDMLRF